MYRLVWAMKRPMMMMNDVEMSDVRKPRASEPEEQKATAAKTQSLLPSGLNPSLE